MAAYLYIIAITAGFVIVAYVGYTLADWLWLSKLRVKKRLDGLAAKKEPPRQTETSTAEPLPTIAKFISSRGLADRIHVMLTRAGVKLRPSEFVGIVSGCALFLSLVAAAGIGTLASEIAAIVVGAGIPFLYIRMLQQRRLAAFAGQLPDALSLIGSAIRSGYAFPRAMQMVSEEMPAPISEEFRRVLNEVNVGLPVDAALGRMVARIPSYDLELVVTAVVIQQQVGGNLAEIIDNIAATIRDRVRVQGELAALTAEGRISGIVLVVLPFGMAALMAVLNPRYLKPLFDHPLGMWLLIGAVCLQALGGLIIKRMLALDY